VQEPVVEPPLGQNRLESGGYGPVGSARRDVFLGDSGAVLRGDGGEATPNGCGVGVAMLQEKSWAPPLSIDYVVNVGTVPMPPFPPHGQCGVGQVRCRLMASGPDGVFVVVAGVTTRRGDRESRLQGEGRQLSRSGVMRMSGGRL